MSAAIDEVNRALAPLAGRPLHSVRAASSAPGRYTLLLEIEGLSLTLVVGPEGIGVQSLTAG